MSHADREPKPGFFDFIGWRRRVISDRTWFGLALLAITFAVPGWWKLIPLATGVALVASGLRRSLNRSDSATGERRPAPPW